MTYRGQVKNGQIVLDENVVLSEGAAVQVEVIAASLATVDTEPKTLYERLKNVAGIAKGLPPDLAAQHDHYIHGTPKK